MSPAKNKTYLDLQVICRDIRFWSNLDFIDILKIPQYQNFTEINPVGNAMIHADRRTDGHGRSRDYANAPKDGSCI